MVSNWNLNDILQYINYLSKKINKMHILRFQISEEIA